MPPASIEPSLTQSSLSPPLSSMEDQRSCSSSTRESRFSNLRGVRWRICLQILPSSPSSTTEEYRRVAAESRRRYASLRRRLLVDPHLQKDGRRIPDPVMDNPLSQDPDSMWGRFFQNAELEKVLDQDLSRLYPEHESYLQTPVCQALLRRILLLWCLKNPECGYRQGMHELLAPLVYVLHVDIQRLSEVRKKYEDHFTDEFDGTSFPESDVVSNYRFAKAAQWDELPNGTQDKPIKPSSLDELDPGTRETILLNDAYGAEGELGVLLSERFLEHDAYCMFDALMTGAHGVVAMADFFSHSPAAGLSTALAPIIEASSALYHLLSLVDPSLHSHLVELGVEPQYFALRWLRVLFGREFPLKDLLLIWDEVFSYPNDASDMDLENEVHPNFRMLHSPRGAFISGMAVSMILHLKPALLATEHATSCLQKLLNFPENTDLKKLIEKAQSLHDLALDRNSRTAHSGGTHSIHKPQIVRGHTLSLSSISPKTPPRSLPESYWEEQWRVLHKEEENKKETKSTSVSGGIIKGFQKARLSLSRTESDPCPSKSSGKTDLKSPIRRNLLDEFSRGSAALVHVEESKSVHSAQSNHMHSEESKSNGLSGQSDRIASSSQVAVPKEYNEAVVGEKCIHSLDCKTEEPCLSGGASPVFSAESSLLSGADDGDNESEERSVTSHSCTGENEEACLSEVKTPGSNGPSASGQEERASTSADDSKHDSYKDSTQRSTTPKEKKLPGKFPWFWKFGRSSEGNSEKVTDIQKPLNSGDSNKDVQNSTSDGCGISGKVEAGEKEVVSTMKNLGHLMLENIQVLESIFQQERGQAGPLENLSNNIFGGKGQSTAMAALKELRNISSILLSEKGK